MPRGAALALLAALLAALGWCARDARRRVRDRAAHDALHRQSAALVGPSLCFHRGAEATPGSEPGVAGARPLAVAGRAE